MNRWSTRPNVTTDAAALCVKASNAAILRGGREARRSNAFLGGLLGRAGLPDGAVHVIADSDHALVTALLGAEIGISTDRIGPRGPMGVAELTSLKWVVLGSGQIRE